MEKIKLLEKFEVVSPVRLRAPKNTKVEEDIKVVEATPESVENIKPVMPVSGVEPKAELPFKFAEMSELCEVIQERLNDSAPFTQNNEQRMKNISTLKRIFGLFTTDGLTGYLNRYTDGDIAQAMKNYRK